MEEEPIYGYSAIPASPQAVAHDEIVNRTGQLQKGVMFVVKPEPSDHGEATATVFLGLDTPHTSPSHSMVFSLEANKDHLISEASEHASDLLSHFLQTFTPDAEINRALSWAEIALDQAWVCNPQLGCGEVAGYGPSRMERRPQYDWFFAGDGLIATQGLLAAGDYTRARDELAFITRYQDSANGMIWHELSQSAGMIDWLHKYPYMYVHVDITFQYLAGFADYVATTGDSEFLLAHWNNIDAAWRYCQSVISTTTMLPQIPAGKEGRSRTEIHSWRAGDPDHPHRHTPATGDRSSGKSSGDGRNTCGSYRPGDRLPPIHVHRGGGGCFLCNRHRHDGHGVAALHSRDAGGP